MNITSPVNGAIVNGTIAIIANASDDIGVTEVRFHVDHVLIGTDATAPYSIAWDTTRIGDGIHALSVTAVDTAGHFATSGFEDVIVGNSGIQPSTIQIMRSEYDLAKKVLGVEATSSDATATLTNEGSGRFRGHFTWPVNPQNITVKSNRGGAASADVVAK